MSKKGMPAAAVIVSNTQDMTGQQFHLAIRVQFQAAIARWRLLYIEGMSDS